MRNNWEKLFQNRFWKCIGKFPTDLIGSVIACCRPAVSAAAAVKVKSEFSKNNIFYLPTHSKYWYIGCKYIRDVKRFKQKRNKLPWTQNTRSIMCGTLKERAASQFLWKFYVNHWQRNTFGGIPGLESAGWRNKRVYLGDWMVITRCKLVIKSS